MTRIMKLIISLLVYIFDYTSRRLLSLFNEAPATCVILYYHAVYAEGNRILYQQMDDLLRWTKPISTK